jgi:hypothetical protein
MTSQKYLNGVLTVIAFCLVILTLSAVGVFPKANAAAVNSADAQKVDIVSVAGQLIAPLSNQGVTTPGSLPTRPAK